MSLQKHCAAYESPMIRLGQLCITACVKPGSHDTRPAELLPVRAKDVCRVLPGDAACGGFVRPSLNDDRLALQYRCSNHSLLSSICLDRQAPVVQSAWPSRYAAHLSGSAKSTAQGLVSERQTAHIRF